MCPDAKLSLPKMGFIYDKSDSLTSQIRLINFSPPDKEDDQIQCHLQIAGLDWFETPKHHALSYTRGDCHRLYHIFVNGKPMEVRENLYLAINRLQRISASVPIWVDAMCI